MPQANKRGNVTNDGQMPPSQQFAQHDGQRNFGHPHHHHHHQQQQQQQQQLVAHGRPNQHHQHMQTMSTGASNNNVGPPIRMRVGGAHGNGGTSRIINNEGMEEDGNRMMRPTPWFERIVTEEVQELKAYARMIESQNRRLDEQQRVHVDLEARLEKESRSRLQLEASLEERERQWVARFRELEAERDEYKRQLEAEATKNQLFMEKMNRKDRDIRSMLKRKYDNQKEAPIPSSHSVRSTKQQVQRDKADANASVGHEATSIDKTKSPRDYFISSGPMEAERINNVQNLLMDFFGL